MIWSQIKGLLRLHEESRICSGMIVGGRSRPAEAEVRQNSALMHFEELDDPNMPLSTIMSVSSVTSDYAAFSTMITSRQLPCR